MDFVSRLPRVSVRTGYKGDFFFVVQWFPKIGVFQDGGWNCHQFHASSEFFADFGNYDVSIDVPARFKGRVGATGRQRRRARDFGRPGPLPIPPEGRPRLRLDGRSCVPGARRRVPGGGAGRRSPHPAPSARACGPGGEALPGGEGRALGLRPGPRRPIRTSTLTIVDPALGRPGRGRDGVPDAHHRGHLLERAEERPPPRGRHRARDRPPVPLRPARLERVRGGVARRGIQHLHDRPRPEVGLRAEPRGAERLRPPLPARDRDPLPARLEPALLRGRRLGRARVGELEVPRAQVLRRPRLPRRRRSRWRPSSGCSARPRWTGRLRLYADRWRFRHPTTQDFIAAVNDSTGQDWTWFFDRTFFSSGIVDYAVAEAESEPAAPPRGPLREGRPPLRRARRRSSRKPRGYDSRVTVVRSGDVAMPVDVAAALRGRPRVPLALGRRGAMEAVPRDVRTAALEAVVDPEEKILLDADRTNNGRRTQDDSARPRRAGRRARSSGSRT